MTRLNLTPIYPVLIGLFPLFSLWNSNRAQQPAYVILPALGLTFLLIGFVWLAARLALREPHNAALAAALLVLLTLSAGRLPAWAALAAVSLAAALLGWIALRRPARPGLTRALNLVSAVMLLSPLLPAAWFYTLSARPASAAPAPIPVTGSSLPRRDVYWIVIDNYSRHDVLSDRFGFDNREFLAALEQRGFVIPACSQSNYPGTVLSLASALNMDYVDTLGLSLEDFYIESRYQFLRSHIRDNAVMRKFTAYGYQTVTFRGYSDLIDIPTANYYVDEQKNRPLGQRLETENFNRLYKNTTLLAPLERLADRHAPRWLRAAVQSETAHLDVYRQNHYALDELEHMPERIPAPRFVYAHLYPAHWPYMFTASGSLRQPLADLDDPAAYLDGVRYLNQRLPAILDRILAAPGPAPIIIIQSDHGNTFEGRNRWSGPDRLKNLSAYYLPGGGSDLLRDDLTPVNTFRLVFQHYFGEELPLLPDVSYFIDPQSEQIHPAPRSCIR